jgi:hypothetical protein
MLPGINLEAIYSVFSLYPGYCRELIVFEGWLKNGAVEINKYNTAVLGILEQVGIALVTVVNTMGPDGFR